MDAQRRLGRLAFEGWVLAAVLGSAACATFAPSNRGLHYGAPFLNDRHEHLYDRPRGLDTPSAFATAAPPVLPPSQVLPGSRVLPVSGASPVSRGSAPSAVASAPMVFGSSGVPPLPPSRGAEQAKGSALASVGASAYAVPPWPAVASLGGTNVGPVLRGRESEPVYRPAPAHLAAWLRHGESPHMRRQRIAAFAGSLVGARRIVVNGRRYASNCSDFVRAVYSIEGIDLYHWPQRPRGFAGVRGMYGLSRLTNALHFRARPEIGDLVFFHNTYDFNRNRRIDDFLSHVGIVERIDDDGTVHYIDRSSGRIKRNRMELARPSVHRDPETRKVLNSHVRGRRRGDPSGTRYLSGDLFAGFGTLIR